MDFILTTHWQYSHHDKDERNRNYLSFYLNDVLILKQKIPFDENYENGYERRTYIYDVYLLNGKLYQKRRKLDNNRGIREVYFPVSKKILSQFNIPKDLIIEWT